MLSKRRITLLLGCLSLLLFLSTPLYAEAESETEGVKQETGMYYTIQKGDTLWDLSTHFYDNPLVWPDLWYQNQGIANPHRIYPGKRIRLYRKEWLNSRSKRSQPVEQVAAPVEEPTPEPEEIYIEKQPLEEQAAPEQNVKEKPRYLVNQIDSVGYMIYETPEERTKYKKENVKNFDKPYIYKVRETSKSMISESDLVYIREPSDTPLTLGGKYTVYRTSERRNFETGNYIGTEYLMVGVVEILRSSSPGYYEANVVQSFNYIEKFDFLMPYTRRVPEIEIVDLPDEGTAQRIDGKIIAAQNNPAMFANNTIAYIDKGAEDSVKIGEQFTVYYQETEIDPVTEKKIPLSPVSYAEFLVLYTTPKTSTVLITKAKKDIYQNALFATKFSDM